MKKIVSGIILTLLLVIITIVPVSATPETPVFAVEPSSQTVPEPGQTFQIDITVTDSPPVVLWALNLTWNPNVLNITKPSTDIVEGDFLKREGSTIFLYKPINYTAGSLREMFCATMFFKTSSGNGVLCRITFTAVAAGHSDIDICWGVLVNPELYKFYPILMDGTVEVGRPSPPFISATININPETLNLISRGKWITAYIELPEGYDVADINVSSISLNDTIPVDPSAPSAIGDYDNDDAPDLMVKFNRAEVISYLISNVDVTEFFVNRFMTVTLTLSGKLYDGTPFQGSDNIRITMPKRWLLAMLLQ
jgi:hypothetical protein